MPVIVVAMTTGRVLVVDEDPLVRLAVDRQLDTLGWDAIAVECGAQAVRVVDLGLTVNVLLTDLRLPDMDGFELARAIGARRPFTRVAFMGDVAPAARLAPRHAPFLLKPFSTQALANALSGAAAIRRHPR